MDANICTYAWKLKSNLYFNLQIEGAEEEEESKFRKKIKLMCNEFELSSNRRKNFHKKKKTFHSSSFFAFPNNVHFHEINMCVCEYALCARAWHWWVDLAFLIMLEKYLVSTDYFMVQIIDLELKIVLNDFWSKLLFLNSRSNIAPSYLNFNISYEN